MKNHVIFCIFLLLLAIPLTAWQLPQQGGGLVAVVNTEGTPDELTATEFRKIIMGEQQRWSNGSKVTIALMKTTHPTGQLAAKQVYKMSGDALNKYWLGLVFQGRAKAPVFFNSEEDLMQFVAVTPGAIGIVSKASNAQVKRLRVQGSENL